MCFEEKHKKEEKERKIGLCFWEPILLHDTQDMSLNTLSDAAVEELNNVPASSSSPSPSPSTKKRPYKSRSKKAKTSASTSAPTPSPLALFPPSLLTSSPLTSTPLTPISSTLSTPLLPPNLLPSNLLSSTLPTTEPSNNIITAQLLQLLQHQIQQPNSQGIITQILTALNPVSQQPTIQDQSQLPQQQQKRVRVEWDLDDEVHFLRLVNKHGKV
jgi:hypothetical protein